jgi:hypothetical protein
LSFNVNQRPAIKLYFKLKTSGLRLAAGVIFFNHFTPDLLTNCQTLPKQLPLLRKHDLSLREHAGKRMKQRLAFLNLPKALLKHSAILLKQKHILLKQCGMLQKKEANRLK